jgi:predicted transcriptional regulator
VCGDLVEELPLAQATVSQHLKGLKSVGLIKGETEGTSVCYCLNEPVWEEAREVLLQLFHLPLTDNSC